MTTVTNFLSSRVYELQSDGETENIQFVPQIVSTLRLDLVFWSNLPTEPPSKLKHIPVSFVPL